MSTTVVSEKPQTKVELEADRKIELDAMCRMIDFGQGRFVFIEVDFDLPRTLALILSELKTRLADLHVVTVRLSPPAPDAPKSYHVLDQLEEFVKHASPDKNPDALIVTGYETWLPDEDGPHDNDYWDKLKRAIQPLNLGRNILAETFPCPTLLCLPPRAMGLFLRSAPDLSSWRSGYFRFEADMEEVRAEIVEAANVGSNWRTRRKLRQQSPEELFAEAERLELLIADTDALPDGKKVEPSVLLRLHERLGWTWSTLGNRTQAREAFKTMLELAGDDRKFIRAAQKGLAQAERLTPQVLISPEKAKQVLEVFRGAAALTKNEGLYGRDEELRQLTSRVEHVANRFLIVWGETGCGKSSLVEAGLVRELETNHDYFLPIVVREWKDPEANIRRALNDAFKEIKPSESIPDEQSSLHDAINYVYRNAGKTVVVVCDQFERFFKEHPQRRDRESFVKAVGRCYRDFSLPCRFVFVVREDELGRMAEFDDEVPEPLGRDRRFYLPLFSPANAERVLQHMSNQADLGWTESFIETVVKDLTDDGRVRPVEVQLVGAALAMSRISDVLAYNRAGGARGLKEDYLETALRNAATRDVPVELLKRVLLALVEEPDKRLTLTADEIARRIDGKSKLVLQALERLELAHLVRRIADPETGDRFELIHDVLIESVFAVTRNVRDKRRQADRDLRRALEDCVVKPRHRVGLLTAWNIRKHADKAILTTQKAKNLLRRSFIWGIILWFVVAPLIPVGLLAFVQSTTSYVSLEQDFNERVVVRRGLPWLTFLPWSNGIVLDTGLTVGDLDRKKVAEGFRPIHWELGNDQSGILGQDEVLLGISNAANQCLRLYLAGHKEEAIHSLLEIAIRTPNPQARRSAVITLENIVRADKMLAATVVKPLLRVLTDGDSSVRDSAITALSQAIQADKTLAATVVEPLLRMLTDGNSSVRGSAAAALGQAIQADKALAATVVEPLLRMLTDGDSSVRGSAATALGQAVQADRTLATKVVRPLLKALIDNNSTVNGFAAVALGKVVQTDKTLSKIIIGPLLKTILLGLHDSNSDSVIFALRQTVKADAMLTPKIFALLLNVLFTDNPLAVESAASALGPIFQADKSLAAKTIQPLLKALEISDERWEWEPVVSVLEQVVQADNTLAEKMIKPLLEILTNSNQSVRYRAVRVLQSVVKVNKNLANIIVEPLLKAFTDNNSSVRVAVASALGQVAQSDKTLAKVIVGPLLKALADSNPSMRVAVASALGQAVQADKTLARTIFEPLLQTLNDESVRVSVTPALEQVARSDVFVAKIMSKPLLRAVKDDNSSMCVAAAAILRGVAQQDEETRSKAFELLVDYNESIRDGVPNSFAELFILMAQREDAPLQFLFDHLEGRQSFLPNGNAITYAVYREVVMEAMAQWLVSDSPKAKDTQVQLRQRLETMCDTDSRLHLRMAAWDALVEAAQLQEEKEKRQSEE